MFPQDVQGLGFRVSGSLLFIWACLPHAQVPPEGATQSLLAAILETDAYAPDAPEQVIRNPDAVPLCFHFLRGAAQPVQAWGLDAWFRLLSGSMANLSACQRCALAPGCFVDGNKHESTVHRITAG